MGRLFALKLPGLSLEQAAICEAAVLSACPSQLLVYPKFWLLYKSETGAS